MTKTLYFKDKHISFGDKTWLMGILNVTPDSFSDGGDHHLPQLALKHAQKMIAQGADIIDVGGESTRPGSQPVSEADELGRVIPVVSLLKAETDTLISIDTYKAKVADSALSKGAHIINDVWGFQKEPAIAKVAADHQVLSILMHNQEGTVYPGDLLDHMKLFFEKSINLALQAGLDASLIMLDPGIGFGKTHEQNLLVMRRLKEIVDWGYPVLLGTSRKSMIGKILDLPPKERVEGTLATTVIGIQAGVDVVRVHDIVENKRAIMVTDQMVRR